jgi:hypothetical protein
MRIDVEALHNDALGGADEIAVWPTRFPMRSKSCSAASLAGTHLRPIAVLWCFYAAFQGARRHLASEMATRSMPRSV